MWPLSWIRKGWKDYLRAPRQSLAYGIAIALLSWLVTGIGLKLGTYWFGSAVGSIFALLTFVFSAFSLPMICDRDADAITAIVTSVNAVLRNKPAMAVWALLIVGLSAIGFATALLGLAVVIPLLGYATWHAYREMIDASPWPANHPD